MAATWQFALFICMLLIMSRGLSLASNVTTTGTADTTSDRLTITNFSTGTEVATKDVTTTGTVDTTSDRVTIANFSTGAEVAPGSETGNNSTEGATSLAVVSWRWEHVSTPYLVALWVLVSWLCKFVIESFPMVTNVIPESALLICFGWILGGIIWAADLQQTFSLTPTVFFYFLLPQIILDAGYSMPNKLFFTNLGGILLYAILGTVWCAATLGLSLWGCQAGGAMGALDIGLLQYLLFGSLIAAVDPVAVLAVFEQVHVNEVLFIMVFGESLLNDGVTVVLFNVFDAFVKLGGPRIDAVEIIKGIISFFIVAFGGSLVGLAFGLLVSLLSKYTKNIQIIEPGFIFVLGYLSYLTADMLSLSAILSVTFCGVSCQKYLNSNMAESSVNTVRYVMKVFANGSETIIFVFLGISAIDKTIWVWNTGFILLTLFFTLVYRFIGTFIQTWWLNQYRLVPIAFIDQLIMSYGGLRGAVAYGLAAMLDDQRIKEKKLMIGTTLIVVYFTVILQGVTMKPFVTWLKVKRAALVDVTLVEKVQNKVFEHSLVAIEDISGQIGDNYLRGKWKIFEEKWMSRFLLTSEARKKQDKIFNVFHQLNIKDAMGYVDEGERRGSLEFVRNESAFIDFKKKFDDEFSEVLPDIMAAASDDPDAMRRDPVSSVSLQMHEKTMQGTRETEDIDAHHLLQQHLYKGRKQHLHRYSRNHLDIKNTDDNEVQEIFQRTMRNRLESFKSAKMGLASAKTITKHTKKDQQQKMPNGTSTDTSKNYYANNEGFESGSEASGGSFPFMVNYRAGAGIENPSFMPDQDPMAPMQIPPWQAEGEPDGSTVSPSQRAQVRLPWTPTNLRRLASLRISNQSTDSFAQADTPASQEKDKQWPPPPPPPSHK